MDLSRLNPAQREAVLCTDGPLLVLAGAGSGKTRVITHRIVQLLEKKRVEARAILGVTFTNKAAAEMKERLAGMVGAKAAGVTLCTFHAFGVEVLRDHANKVAVPRRFAIADYSDQVGLVKRAMRDRRVDDRAFDPRKVLTIISRAKNQGEIPAPKPEGMGDDYDLIAAEVFPLYQRGLRAQGAVDFDDLLVLPAQLFDEHPKVLAEYHARLAYLLVDEFQDTNRAQLRLLVQLAGERKNVCAVGDDDQSIYSWRGADVRNILDFERHFPGAKVVRLEQNYRSTQLILDAANAVIAKSVERRPKRMWTDRTSGPPLSVVVAESEEQEARFVAHEVAKAIAMGVSPREIAVLYRTNGQADLVEEALREKGVRYEVVGGTDLFDRREVKDAVAYLKAIANPRDELSLLRIVNHPPRGIGDVTMERLLASAHGRGVSLWDTMRTADQQPELGPGTAAKVAEFCQLIDRYRQLFRQGRLADAGRRIFDEIGLREAAASQASSAVAAQRKMRSIEQVVGSLERFEAKEATRVDLLHYLNRLSLDTREEEDEPSGSLVSLMTLHASKGLEFELVLLIGLEEDLLPHGGMQGEPQNLEEERRLCYVGITRAKTKLFLTRAAARIKRGKAVPRTPSRFLEDLPAEVVSVQDLGAPAPPPQGSEGRSFFANLRDRLKSGEPKAGGA